MLKSFLKDKTLGLFVKTNGIFSKPIFSGSGFFICLHRVLPKNMRDKFWKEATMAVSPEYLEWLILKVRERGVEWVSIDEACERIAGKKTNPFAVMTLDDGWKDNLTYAYPIFKKHKVPFCVYIATCFPDGTEVDWAEALTRIVESREEFSFEFEGKKILFQMVDRNQKIEAYNKIRLFLLEACSVSDINLRIKAVFADSEFPKRVDALSWIDLASLSRDELCTIGAHTNNHVPLAKFQETEAYKEMIGSQRLLEEKINKPIKHFAYPFGSKNECSKREFCLAGRAGFKSAVTGRPGNVFKGHRHHMAAVPRYVIGESTNEERLNYIINGVLHFSFNGFKQIVTD